MSIYSVRILINSFIKRPCTHFRSFAKSSCLFNKATKKAYTQRHLTKRETNLHRQLIQRYMAAPMNDSEIEKLLEPLRQAVKIQVKRKSKSIFYLKSLYFFFRAMLLNK